MRTDDIAFFAQNTAPFSSPRYVVELSFALDNSIIYYLTSHADTPTPNGTNTIHDVIEKISGTSQKVDVARFQATIGNLSIDLADIDEAVTDLLRAQDLAGRSLTKKRIRVYMGFEGLPFSSFALIQTQIIQNLEYQDGGYKLSAQDVQRETRKQLFEVKETPLTANISEGATSITVESTYGFEMVAHGAGWTDAPNATVGYLYIENNDDWAIARYTGKTATTFTGVTWESLHSRPRQFLIIDGGQTNGITVRELVYLELPAVKMAYALLTGTLYGQAGAFLPAHWHCGVPAQYISTSHFVNIGADLWVTTNDERGPKLRFVGISNEDGRNFIQQEILPAINCFQPVLSTGELALKRLQPVLSNSAHVVSLDADNVVSAGAVRYALADIANKYRIDWAWDFREERFRRSNILYDQPSITKYGASDVRVLELKGLHGDVHSPDFLRNMFDGYRDRFSGPPITLSVDLLPKLNTLEVGDVVRVDLSHLPDFSGDNSLSRAMEVQQVKIDWLTGRVSVDLFGSTQKAGLLTDYGGVGVNPASGNAIADAWYNVNGVNIETAFAGSVSRSGSNVTLTADITLNGGALLAFLGVLVSDCVFYVLGDFIIPVGRTLYIGDNVCLKVRGFLTINGTINGAGRGPAGEDHRRWHRTISPAGIAAAAGVYLGARVLTSAANASYPAAAKGAVHADLVAQPPLIIYRDTDTGVNRRVYAYNVLREGEPSGGGQFASLPTVALAADLASSDPAYLAGLPSVLHGGAGRAGGSLYDFTAFGLPAWISDFNAVLHGGDGGAGGAGLVVFCRGADFGASGKLNLNGGASGSNMQTGATGFDGFPLSGAEAGAWGATPIFAAGAGAGGSPGSAYFFIDGNSNTPPIISGGTVDAFYGNNVQSPGDARLQSPLERLWAAEPASYVSIGDLVGRTVRPTLAADLQQSAENQWYPNTRVQILVAPIAASDDSLTEADAPLSITLTEHTNTPVTPAGNRSSIDVAVTPPTDPDYSYAWAEYRKLGDTAWTRIAAPAQPETVFSASTDGSTWQVRALSVSKRGVVARTGPIAQITLANFTANPAAVRAAGAVFDLRIAGQAVGANTFNTRDLALTWAYRSALAIDYVLDDWFSHFRVTVRNGATVRGTIDVRTPTITLSVEQLAVLNGGSIFAAIGIDVCQVTVDGTLGAAQSVTFTNTAPSAPTAISTAPSDYGTVIRWTNPAAADLQRVELHLSQTSGFTPSTSTRYFTGLTESFTPAALHPLTTYYGQIRVVDVYGNASSYASFTFTTADVAANLKNENQNWSDINDDNGQMPAPNADVTADSPAHQALESSVTSLEQQVASLGGTGFNLVLPAYGNFEGTPSLSVANGTAVTSAEAYKFVAKSLKLTPTAANNFCHLGASATDYNTPISPSSKWILSCYVMAPVGTNVAVQLYVRADGGTYYPVNATTDAVAGTWKRVYGLVDLSADASDSCLLRVDNDGGSGVVVYFDALQLERYVGVDSNPPPSAYKDPIESVTSSAAFQALSQTVTTQGGTIASHTSSISGINSTLTNKADQSWVNTQIANAAPTDLADVDAAAAAKLAGIAAGADVTATSAAMTAVQGTVTSQGNSISTLSSQQTTMNDSIVLSRQATANVLLNGLLTSEASDGRPASVFAAYGNTAAATVSFLDATNKSGLKLYSASDSSIGAAFGAIPIIGGQPISLRIRYKASAASASGFYFRMQEYDGDVLPAGGKFIATNGGEAGVVAGTRDLAHLISNAAITTSWQTQVLTYTPTATAKWASPLFLNWTGMGLAELHIDYCLVIPGAWVLANAQTVQALEERVQATEDGVSSNASAITSISTDLPGMIDTAKIQAFESTNVSLYAGTVFAQQGSARRIAFRINNASASLHVWRKIAEFELRHIYAAATLRGEVRYGENSRFQKKQSVFASLLTSSPITTVTTQFAIDNSSFDSFFRVFREVNGTTSQRLAIYTCMQSFDGMEAVFDVFCGDSSGTTSTVTVWQQGLAMSADASGYLPPGTEITPVYNRGVADNADVTANSAAFTSMSSTVTAINGTVSAHASQLASQSTAIGTAQADITSLSESIDGVTAHHTVMTKATSDAGVAIAGISLLSSVAGGTPASKVRIEADQFEVLRSASQAGTKWGLVYDATLGLMTVPALSVGNAQIANAAIVNAKITDATLTRAKLASGALGAFYQATANVWGGLSTWGNLFSLPAATDAIVVSTPIITNLEAIASQYLVVDYQFKMHIDESLFGLRVAADDYSAASGPDWRVTITIICEHTSGGEFNYIADVCGGHGVDFVNSTTLRGWFFTQLVSPALVPNISGRMIIPWPYQYGTYVSLMLRSNNDFFRLNNIVLSVNVLKF